MAPVQSTHHRAGKGQPSCHRRRPPAQTHNSREQTQFPRGVSATYSFASEDHKERFLKDPTKYLPEYGGFCAFGTAKGVKVDGDPTVWTIVDNKLYLNLAPAVAERWDQDIAGYIKTADEKWQAVKDKAPSELQR
jgi:YHS domain-containing protein